MATPTEIEQLAATVDSAWEDKTLLQQAAVQATIRSVIDGLDKGLYRVAVEEAGQWQVHAWLKKAIVLYFLIQDKTLTAAGPWAFYDKIPLKQNFTALGVRVVPPATARYGACVRSGVVLMASYVNIGAYVDAHTMVDIGAVIGSCAQLGKHIHVSAGAVIGGVLEPIQEQPVIIEDGVFIGAQCVVAEGVWVQKEAILGAGVTLTASTHIVDVTQAAGSKEYRGWVPARSVVIPGTYPKPFPAGIYQVPCALIIGQRTQQTDLKVSLNQALREYHVSV
ncbi:MAG: 2,3,4,5-tetrahydropyridine-2,6-dicarboxylate N-succinyltransferase [Bacteroidota bacterium]